VRAESATERKLGGEGRRSPSKTDTRAVDTYYYYYYYYVIRRLKRILPVVIDGGGELKVEILFPSLAIGGHRTFAMRVYPYTIQEIEKKQFDVPGVIYKRALGRPPMSVLDIYHNTRHAKLIWLCNCAATHRTRE
jgi:hypothetical protein